LTEGTYEGSEPSENPRVPQVYSFDFDEGEDRLIHGVIRLVAAVIHWRFKRWAKRET